MITRFRNAVSWKPLLVGQLASVLITLTGITSQTLSNAGLDAPTAQSTVFYLLLGVSCLVWWQWRTGGAWIQLPWYAYVGLALVDVEANALVVAAYQSTTITSVLLLDCLTIPVAMVLSWRFLGARFTAKHVGAAMVALLGIVVLLFSDAYAPPPAKDAPSGADRLRGDLLCVAGACLYAVSNVLEETLLRRGHHFHRPDLDELLGMLGIIGAGISTIQASILERDGISHAVRRLSEFPTLVLPLAGFVVAMMSLYLVGGSFLRSASSGGASAYNLSLLTSDAMAAIAAVVVFHQALSPLYFVALSLSVAGVIAWYLLPSPVEEIVEPVVDEEDAEQSSEEKNPNDSDQIRLLEQA